MSRHPCPVCGDPTAFPLWVDPEPPEGCPDDIKNWGAGRAPRIRSIAECPSQMERAQRAAEWRRVAPEAFDADGNIKPGMLAHVFEKWVAAGQKNRRFAP